MNARALLATACLWSWPTLVRAEPPEAFDACEAEIEASPGDWRGYNCIYRIARTQGRYDEAISRLEAIVTAHPERVWAKSYLAAHYADDDDPRTAALWEQTIDGFIAAKDLENEVYTRLSFADFLARSDFDAARAQLSRASTAAASLDAPRLVALVDVEQARQMLREEADLVEALRLVKQSLATLESVSAYQQRLTALHVHAGILHAMGMLARAAEIRRQELEWAQAHDDPLAETSALLNLAILYANNPNLFSDEDGLSLARRALQVAESHQLPAMQAQAHCLLGDLRDGDARAHYRQCADLLGTDLVFRGVVEQGLAMLDVDDDPEAAFAHADEAVRLGRVRGNDTIDEQKTRAVLRWRHGPRPQAVAESMRLLDLVDRAIARQKNPLGRARFLAMSSPFYYYVAERVVSDHPTREDVELGLRIIERMRTRVLVEQLDKAHALGPPSADDPLWQAHEDAVHRLAATQKRLLSEDLDANARQRELEALERTEEEASALWDAILDADPRVSNIRHGRTPTLADIQSTLRPGQALLSFQLSPGLPLPQPAAEPVASWVAVITRDSARVHPLPSREELDDLVTLFVGLFAARDGSEAITAVGLYERLVGPALAELGEDVDSLVLVPDAGLHGLPFAALREHADAAPLGTRFALTTAPSISLWLRVKTPRRDASDAALVLADPPPLPAGALSMDEPLGPLPMARDEARIFVERLAPDAESRLGSDASEAFVKQGGLRARGVIHLAAHALLDEEHPERAAVVLAGGAEEEDGLLQMREITRLDVPGALVVLASCRSASGTVIGAEGPIGLSRAFFVAGARTVVASLWRIRDDEAAAFFEAFYRHLAEGRTVADAVRAAQIDRQRAGAPAAGWAGFVVLGDGDLAPVPTRASSRWWWLLPLPFLFAGVGLLIANRESARPRAP